MNPFGCIDSGHTYRPGEKFCQCGKWSNPLKQMQIRVRGIEGMSSRYGTSPYGPLDVCYLNLVPYFGLRKCSWHPVYAGVYCPSGRLFHHLYSYELEYCQCGKDTLQNSTYGGIIYRSEKEEGW